MPGTSSKHGEALSPGELLVLGGAALMLLASLLPWYEVDLIIETAALNGWQEPGVVWSVLAVAFSVAAGFLVLKRSIDAASLPELPPPLTWPRVLALAGLLPLVCVWLKLLNDGDFVAYGFYVAFAAAGLTTAGGVWIALDEHLDARRAETATRSKDKNAL